MPAANVFLSVGRTSTARQETFVSALEQLMRRNGLRPQTVGRTSFSVDQPLKHVMSLMRECSGTMIVAFERVHVERGAERRGSESEVRLADCGLPTVWNQIEAAMSYVIDLPLMVLVEHGLRSEGLLEKGYDWYVQSVDLDPKTLKGLEFRGVFDDWKSRVKGRAAAVPTAVETAG
jgi:hypothetical protein